jgi:hypothetical protein
VELKPGPWTTIWEEAKNLIRERMRLKVPQTGRVWTREELHDRWEQHHPD